MKTVFYFKKSVLWNTILLEYKFFLRHSSSVSEMYGSAVSDCLYFIEFSFIILVHTRRYKILLSRGLNIHFWVSSRVHTVPENICFRKLVLAFGTSGYIRNFRIYTELQDIFGTLGYIRNFRIYSKLQDIFGVY